MNDDKLLSGSAESTELTENQTKLVNLNAYFGKIAMTIAQTPVSSRYKKPDGFRRMMEKIKADGKDGMTLKPEEWEKYEKELFEEITEEPLGQTSQYLQFFLLELSQNTEVRKLMDAATKEALMLAERTDNTRFVNPKDLSRFT